MSLQATAERPRISERERELGAIIKAYSEVTEQLKLAHDRLNGEVSRLGDELKRKNAQLRRRDRLAALGEMAAGLAHEIRNPLGGMALYASMLEGELETLPKARSAATKISKAVRSLERLVSDILDFAQEDRLDRQVIQLGPILARLEESLLPWAEQYGAVVDIQASAGGVEADCDPGRLGQVLLNLMMNGLQAAGAGGVVGLSAKPLVSKDDAGGVRIEVWDSGPGIAAEALDRIFNPFYTTKDTGTGLGLAIVHRIVEAHGGTIRATNRTEGGARFSLTLPRLAEKPKAEN
jgi:two-component system sensor histidine kinase HydH